MRKQIRRHLRDGEQGNNQHDAYHAQACNNGQCNEHHQYIFEYLYGNTL